MSKINYNNRRFLFIKRAEDGLSDTIFHYYQDGDVVWGTYDGGTIIRGSFLAKADADGILDLRFQHVNVAGEIMTGICQSTPEIMADGRIRLHEDFQWTCGDYSRSTSMVEEIRE
jgi:hypothetical protein